MQDLLPFCHYLFYMKRLVPRLFRRNDTNPSMNLTEVIVHNCILINTETVEIICYCLNQHGRTAEIVFTIFWCLMILQVGIADAVNRKSGIILYTCSIGFGVLVVERQVEMEVGEFLLKFPEVFQEEGLAQGARTIEEMHLSVSRLERLGHVHLCPSVSSFSPAYLSSACRLPS